ncbi:MAG: replication initiation protein [Actinomycetota bacterium]|nr:replication initiation protein [Actinomycetota bacterium]
MVDAGQNHDDATGGGLPPMVVQALRRVSRPDYARWEAMMHASGCCAQPVRLAGRVLQADPASGELHVVYTTAGEADQVLLKACETRRATRCPACAAIYRGDARVLLRSGLDVDGSDQASDDAVGPTAFVTLTAPSFGAVHRFAQSPATCRPGPGSKACPHGRPIACVEPHEPEDAAVGEALCPDCYDWENAVIFNARVGALWHHTVIGVNRQLANAAGIRVRMFARSWRLSFAKVVEFQARGVVHVHALIRLDHLDESPTVLDASDLVSAFAAAAARVTVQNPLNPGWRVRWGTQTDLQPIPPERRRVAAAYLAKYATKSVDGAGLLDHRLTSNHHLEQLDLPEQLRRMAAVAWELGGRPDLQDLNLRAWAHCLGYRGHWLTKSRYWSTTFTELRARRQAWRLDQLGIDPDDRHRWVGEWSYQGVGHLTAGDAWLAGSAAAGRELNRRIAWEER